MKEKKNCEFPFIARSFIWRISRSPNTLSYNHSYHLPIARHKYFFIFHLALRFTSLSAFNWKLSTSKKNWVFFTLEYKFHIFFRHLSLSFFVALFRFSYTLFHHYFDTLFVDALMWRLFVLFAVKSQSNGSLFNSISGREKKHILNSLYYVYVYKTRFKFINRQAINIRRFGTHTPIHTDIGIRDEIMCIYFDGFDSIKWRKKNLSLFTFQTIKICWIRKEKEMKDLIQLKLDE